MKTLILATTVVGLVATLPAAAAELTPRERLDRLEDRIDRRESYIDRQTNNGRWDRIEDVIDRREDFLDRKGIERHPIMNRHERRSWRRLWGRQG